MFGGNMHAYLLWQRCHKQATCPRCNLTSFIQQNTGSEPQASVWQERWDSQSFYHYICVDDLKVSICDKNLILQGPGEKVTTVPPNVSNTKSWFDSFSLLKNKPLWSIFYWTEYVHWKLLLFVAIQDIERSHHHPGLVDRGKAPLTSTTFTRKLHGFTIHDMYLKHYCWTIISCHGNAVPSPPQPDNVSCQTIKSFQEWLEEQRAQTFDLRSQSQHIWELPTLQQVFTLTERRESWTIQEIIRNKYYQ